MEGCETDRCIIDALAAAKAGDREANYALFDADQSDDRRHAMRFRCGGCALQLTIELPRRLQSGPLADLGVIKLRSS